MDDWENAITTAFAGSTVALRPGVYTGSCNIKISQDVRVVGLGGLAATTIDCQGSQRHVRVTGGANVTMEGISFVGGVSEDDGGCALVVEKSQLHVRLSRFVGCASSSAGGAIQTEGSRLELDEVHFSRCESAAGGGCLSTVNSTVTILSCSFIDCHSAGAGGGIFSERSQVQAEGVRMLNNTADESG